MGNTVIVTSSVVRSGMQIEHQLNFLERLMLRRAHPISLFINATAFIWFVYFLWSHMVMESILVVLAARMAALALTWNIDIEGIAKTTLGKIALLHLHPFNLIIQLCALIPGIYGIWSHDGRLMMVGISLILLGHLRGWGAVEKSFETI